MNFRSNVFLFVMKFHKSWLIILETENKSKISPFRTEEIGKGENENNPFGVEDIVEKRGRLSVPDEFFEIEKNIGCCSWREIFVSQT
ncbi:hypothetical protein BFR41_01420 [Brochothrix thermosphacta]|nr:hypothetical protein BFR41_01420 [Brochothrix thermosphacta]ODJ72435.1 hypothetical protein BFR43_01810 [Brochothrix thermosphacta]